MTYPTEFPDFVLGPGIEMPAGFSDTSWHNDACPSFALLLEDERAIRIFVDYLDLASREMPEYQRFGCSVGVHCSEAESGTVLNTDDWQEVLSWVKLQVQTEREAFVAARVLHIKREVLRVASRGLPFYEGGPALPFTIESFGELHDYCDANELGGLCDDDIVAVGNALFPKRTDPDTVATQQLMDACNVIQNKVNAWIVAGEMKTTAEFLAKASEAQRERFFSQPDSEVDHFAADGEPATGWPPGMLQDDSRPLSTWLANRPGARSVAAESAQQIGEAT